MTIHELLQAAGLTASDEIPIWDADGTGEPTKKITAQQLAAAVVALANLVTSVNNQTGAVSITPANIGAVSKSGDTMTGPLTTNSDIIQTSGHLKGQGENYTNHALKLGHAGDDVMQFFEYGGRFDFIKSRENTRTTLFQIKDGVSAYPLPVNNGGIGATTPAQARANLEITPANIGAVIDISTGPTWTEWTNPLPYDVFDTNIDHMKSNFRAIFDTMKLYSPKMCMGVWSKNGMAMFLGYAYESGDYGDLFFKNAGAGPFYHGRLDANTITVLSVNETVLG